MSTAPARRCRTTYCRRGCLLRQGGRGVGQLAYIRQNIGQLGIVPDAWERHLVAGYGTPGIVQIGCQRLPGPLAALALHRLRVREPGVRARLAADDAPKVGPGAVRAALLRRVARQAFLEAVLAIVGVGLRQQSDDRGGIE